MWMMAPETIREYYNGPYRETLGTADVTDRNVTEQLARAEKLIEFMNNDIGPSNVLDIGSSTGLVLKVLRDVYKCDVLGVELSGRFTKYSRGIGVDVIDDIDKLKGQKFDMITIFHTLEHLTRPRVVLEKARELMTDNGKLFVEVPFNNYKLAHPIVFTEETLVKILNKTGFEVEKKTVNKKNMLVQARCDT